MASTFKNAIKSSIGTSPTVCYTTPVATVTTLIGLSIANTLEEAIYVNITITDTSTGVTAFVGKNLLVPARGSLIAIGGEQKVVLEATDTISVSSSSAASADVVLSYLEVV